MLAMFKNICPKCNSEEISPGFACTRSEVERGEPPKQRPSNPLITRHLCNDCINPTDKKRGNQIKSLRLSKSVTLREAASILGVLPSTLSQMERGLVTIQEEIYCSAIMRLDRIEP